MIILGNDLENENTEFMDNLQLIINSLITVIILVSWKEHWIYN